MFNTENTVKKLITNLDCCWVSLDEVTVNDALQEIGVDSFGTVELLANIEKTFNINISDEELFSMDEWMATVGMLIQFVNAKINLA